MYSPAMHAQIQSLRTAFYKDAIAHVRTVAKSAIAKVKKVLGCAGVAWETSFDESTCKG
jgi:hypothetical protein